MQFKLATTCFAVGAVLAAFAANAAGSDADSFNLASYVKDSIITTKIKTQLAVKHAGSMNDISVDTDRNGIVWLTGTANNQAEVDQAVAIARNIEGVKTVKSGLTIQKDP